MKYPHPQPQETPRDVIVRLARYMLQLERARASAQTLVKQLEERNGALRDAYHDALNRVSILVGLLDAAERQLGETQAALGEANTLLEERRALCDLLSSDSRTVAGQTLVEALRAISGVRE